jgi:hypothetical protein
VMVAGGIAGGIYLVLAYLLRVEELHWLIRLIRSKLGMGV